MAKKEEARPGKSKMTVMVFQLEGSDETLQEGMRRITEAVQGTLKPQLRIASPVRDSVPNAVSPVTKEENGEQNGDSETGGDDMENIVDAPSSSEGEIAQRKRTFRSPKVLDLNLKAAPVQLEEYCKQKNAGDSDQRRYLVITNWYKDQLAIPEVTADHIHTAYRTLGWHTPKVAAQPFANLKQRGFLHKGGAKGAYKMNHVGENHVSNAKADA